MNNIYDYKVFLSIFSKNTSCNEMQNIFGLEFDECKKKGNTYKDTSIVYDNHEGRVFVKNIDSIYFDEYFEFLFSLIKDKKEHFNSNEGDCKYVLNFIITATNEPPLVLKNYRLKFLGDFGIDLNIDQYISK